MELETKVKYALLAHFIQSNGKPMRASDLAKAVGTNSKRLNEVCDKLSREVTPDDIEVATGGNNYTEVRYRMVPAYKPTTRWLASLLANSDLEGVVS